MILMKILSKNTHKMKKKDNDILTAQEIVKGFTYIPSYDRHLEAILLCVTEKLLGKYGK